MVELGLIENMSAAEQRHESWSIHGSYFESCNCEAVCPCRRINGLAGGRSTHGICTGVLTWRIEAGEAEGVDLGGLAVALAFVYDDDEPGSPWQWTLYLDDKADHKQQGALEAIFTGRLGGDADTHFPWAWKPSQLIAVRTVGIEVDHTRRRQWLRIRDHATVRIRDRHPGDYAVTCVIPGHDRQGEELIADELRIDDHPLSVEFEGTCGYAADFAYRG